MINKNSTYAESRTTKISVISTEFISIMSNFYAHICEMQFKQIIHIKVYVAEAEGIPEYGTTTTLGKRLVAVKFLLPEASEKEK